MKSFLLNLLSRSALTRFSCARKARHAGSAGIIVILLLLLLSALIAWRGAFAVTPATTCEPGVLDTSFNGTGIVTTAIADRYDNGHSVALQGDGKIVVAGTSDGNFAVVRYNSDGSLDTSFNGTGKVTTDVGGSGGDLAYSVAIQGDGKIVVAGYTYINHGYADFAVVRYNSDGSLDTSFNGTGKVITDISGNHDQAYSVAIQGDGKIVVAGESYIGSGWDFALVRYNTDGSLDTSLNGTGKVTTPIGNGSDSGKAVAIDGDGKIVLAGSSYNGANYDVAVVRYTGDGSLDTSFNGTGKVTTAIGTSTDGASSVTIQTDGKIVAAGSTSNGSNYDDFAVVRYNSDGSLDTSFNGTGKVTTAIGSGYDVGHSVAIDGAGKIVVAGYSYNGYPDFAVVRYNNDGSLDTSLNGTGKVTTPIGSNYDDGYAVAIQGDGKLVVAGYTSSNLGDDFAVIRYNSDGSLNTSFNGTGKVTTNLGGRDESGYSVAIQGDGKIVVAGYGFNGGGDHFAIVRYNGSGSLDTSFASTGKVSPAIGINDIGQSVAIQSDGKIVVAGASNSFFPYDFAVVRYNSDGSPDIAFGPGGTVTTDIGGGDDLGQSVTIQTEGKILVAGYSYNGANYDVALVRYNSDGSLDISFNGTGKVTTPIGSGDDLGQSVTIQSDGKIVVAGYSYNGANYDVALIRYNSNGSLDTSFNGTGKVTTPIGSGDDHGYAVAIQGDGKIFVAGESDNGFNLDFALVRYNNDGSLDTSFNGTGIVTTGIGTSDDAGQSMALQNDGKIIVAGLSNNGSDDDIALVRYNSDGSLDTSVNGTGKVTTPIGSSADTGYAVAIQSDGKIVVTGASSDGSTSDIAVVRYFGCAGPVPTPTPTPHATATPTPTPQPTPTPTPQPTATPTPTATPSPTPSPTATPTATPMPTPLPRVTVTVTSTQINEGQTATYRVRASSAVAQDTTVTYTMSGTATSGSDYTLNPAGGQVTVLAGQSAALVKLKAKTDGLTEGTETAIMTLQAGTGYRLGNPKQATVSILDP